MPSEIDTLLKHIQMVLDRLGKGARLTALTPPTSSGVSGSTASNESTDSRK